MDALVQEKVRQKENELNATYDEKLMNYEERYVLRLQLLRPLGSVPFMTREKDLKRQLSLTQQQLKDLRISNDTNQAKLLDQSERQGTQSEFNPFAIN